MEFARRGPATADDDEGVLEEGRRFLNPPPLPPHGDAMLVIRDALLLQLQQDRLRQEIIVAELAKIDRTMALSSTSCHGTVAGDVKWTKPPPFSFSEKFMPHRRWQVSPEHWADLDCHYDLKEGARHGGPESRTLKSAMEDCVGECSRSCCTGKVHGENATADEQRLQAYNENMQHKRSSPIATWELTGITMPVKKPKSTQKWSCTICDVLTHSECQLEEHYAGRKHRSNVANMESRNKPISQMVETTAEPLLCAGLKTCLIKWSCCTCQANGTSEAELKEHLNSSTHQLNIEEQCKEGDGMAEITEPQEAKSHQINVPQHAEKQSPVCSICLSKCTRESELGSHLSVKILPEINNIVRNSESWETKLPPNSVPQHAEQTSHCSISQANCDWQSDLADHLEGKKHLVKTQALHEEETENTPLIDKSQPASEWNCSICEAKCYTESHFEHHCRGKKHRKKIAALQGEGTDAKLGALKVENKVLSDGSDSISATSDKVEEQMTPCVCHVCNLLCSSESIHADHRTGEQHLEKPKLLNFCEVCDLQCSSEKMLVHHCTGKKHLKRLNAKK
ncbi:hypothetical protein QOZ80_6AG0535480 [Eleusine coracana subsp. coracana]|nr:hypothetical protein QOZ80_6AG0535480 [Eleusine coracana subsp. coracana]